MKSDWTMAAFRAEGARAIKREVGKGRVICGLSGGVDSAVAAVLIHEAIGDQLTCVFVDHGLMRAGEGEQVVKLFRGQFNIPLIHVAAERDFLRALDGVSEPELKRKTIAGCSSRPSRRKRRRSPATAAARSSSSRKGRSTRT